jgi:hypothetical protein
VSSIIRALWNRYIASRYPSFNPFNLRFGHILSDGEPTNVPFSIPHARRPEHIAVLGKTGAGKSSLLRFFCSQDIRSDRGFVFFDLHGDATESLLSLIADEEKRRGADLSGRLIIIDPSDRRLSVGINVLEGGDEHSGYVQVAEIAQLLKERWHLDTLGVRTEELLRNGLLVLRANDLTILELAPLLTDPFFRADCLRLTPDGEPRRYFTRRYEPLSETMKGVFREAVLNKLTAFLADPHFRHLLGQARSTVDLRSAIDSGFWIIINLDKGRLGEQATTVGSLLLSRIKHTLFSRTSRRLLTLYCDELQNLVQLGSGVESLLAEARKLSVSVVTANQYLAQYSSEVRAAVLSVGTLCFFQLGGTDAEAMARVLGGGRRLRERLGSLPKQELIVRHGGEPHQHVRVPSIVPSRTDPRSISNRSVKRFARPRDLVEAEIQARTAIPARSIDAWE